MKYIYETASKTIIGILTIVSSIGLNSCVKDINLYEDPYANQNIVKENFFDFATVDALNLKLDYGIADNIIYYLYNADPMVLVDGSWELNQDIEPIYAGVTDIEGRAEEEISLPALLKTVWLLTDHVLVKTPIEIAVQGGSINYIKHSEASLSTRAMMGEIQYPDGYDVLGSWNADGVPDYLLAEKEDMPDAFLRRCNTLASSITFDTKNPLLDKFPELTATGTNDMVIVSATELVATYFKSSSSWENMVAYYTYQDGEELTLADINSIKKTILFPRYSNKAPAELLGNQVRLKYWNKETESYENTFPRGTRIGWLLLGMGWNKTSATVRYSNPSFNADGKQRSVLLSDPELDNCFFMAMEDNLDARFNDAQFAIMSSQPKSIEPTPVIPDQVDKGEVAYMAMGTLVFEDNWPFKGDYDMNDVVINFQSTIVKDGTSGLLTRTTTTYTPVNNGAIFTNGFGFQLDHVAKNQVKSLTVSSNGMIINESFEDGTDKPVVTLFDDIRGYLNRPITVVLEYYTTRGGVTAAMATPPYNPFVFSRSRGHEIHLAGYQPTSKMDESLRGTGEDIKQDDKGEPMYFISRDNMPFALYIAKSYFDFPDEEQDIRDKYPHFMDWVNSFGKEYTDWYLR